MRFPKPLRSRFVMLRRDISTDCIHLRAGFNAPKKEKKLSYKLEYELKELPTKIETTSKLIKELNDTLKDPDFYQKDPSAFHQATKDLSDAQAKLDRYETRWLELEEMKSGN